MDPDPTARRTYLIANYKPTYPSLFGTKLESLFYGPRSMGVLLGPIGLAEP